MKHTWVVSTKCTPGFACRAFSDTTLVCFIVNEHTTKCSRYIDTLARQYQNIETEIRHDGCTESCQNDNFLCSQWMKSTSNELDITIHVIASQLYGHCDIISNRLWCHQQNENWASETQGRCVKIVVSIVSYGFVMSCKKWNNVYTRVTVSALTWVLLWCLFPSLLRNTGNKHQNNPFVSAEAVRHWSTYIIIYIPSRYERWRQCAYADRTRRCNQCHAVARIHCLLLFYNNSWNISRCFIIY